MRLLCFLPALLFAIAGLLSPPAAADDTGPQMCLVLDIHQIGHGKLVALTVLVVQELDDIPVGVATVELRRAEDVLEVHGDIEESLVRLAQDGDVELDQDVRVLEAVSTLEIPFRKSVVVVPRQVA